MFTLSLGGLFLAVVVIGWITGKLFKRIIYRSWSSGNSGMWWHFAAIMFGLSWPIIGSTTPIREYEQGAQILALWGVTLAYFVSWVISKRSNKVERLAIRVITEYTGGSKIEVRVALIKSWLMKRTVSVFTSAGEYSVYFDVALKKGAINQKGAITNFNLLPDGLTEEWIEFE